MTMGNVPVLPYEPKRHYDRFRPLVMMDGAGVRALTTRYTYEMGTRISKRKGPRGGKRYERFARYVYYFDGRFYKNENVPVGPDVFENRLAPIDGVIWDAHERQSVEQNVPVLRIWCDDGVPFRAEHEEFGTVWTSEDGLGELESWLHLDKQPRRSPRKVA